uniref:Uncharacterized protein n=1 Tax=Picea glauca TaxID=3330 RepID=A0A101M421_PICGL|nr:hypothetical protein ABT39_MTgene422 [Picea glauca]
MRNKPTRNKERKEEIRVGGGLLPTTLFVLQAGFLPFSTHCMRRTSVSGLVSAFPSPPLLLYGRGIGMRK